MDLVFLVLGVSGAIVFSAVMIDWLIDVLQRRAAIQSAREKAIKTLTTACRLKNGLTEKYQSHGTHRRAKVS
ncbi:hypothetical protein SEA_LIBERTYBELL_59 [Streptomyces phage LibertyBell]|nr:hypothetical protein SEA_LIBERTYBELL_59 [Streptomyces phage LibertyBell]